MTHGTNSVTTDTKPATTASIPTGWRPHDGMTVDDMLRARVFAVVLKEPGMVAKLDRELSAILATHNAIAAAMQAGGPAPSSGASDKAE